MELIKVTNDKGQSHEIEESQLAQFAKLGFTKEGSKVVKEKK